MQSNIDKMYTKAIKIIKRYCSYLDLRENVIKQVEEMYHEIQNEKELKGKRQDLIIAGCIYVVCNKNRIHINRLNLEPLINLESSKLLHIVGLIQKYVKTDRMPSHEYLQDFCKTLSIPKMYIDIMKRVCEYIESVDFFKGQLPKPKTVAAGVMYWFTDKLDPQYRYSLTELRQVAGIKTNPTITKMMPFFEESAVELAKFLEPKQEASSPEKKEENSPKQN